MLAYQGSLCFRTRDLASSIHRKASKATAFKWKTSDFKLATWSIRSWRNSSTSATPVHRVFLSVWVPTFLYKIKWRFRHQRRLKNWGYSYVDLSGLLLEPGKRLQIRANSIRCLRFGSNRNRSGSYFVAIGRSSAGRSVVNRIRRITCTQDTLPVLCNNLRLRLKTVRAIGLTSVNRRGTVSQLPTEIGTVRVAERWPRGLIGFTRICNRFPSSTCYVYRQFRQRCLLVSDEQPRWASVRTTGNQRKGYVPEKAQHPWPRLLIRYS